MERKQFEHLIGKRATIFLKSGFKYRCLIFKITQVGNSVFFEIDDLKTNEKRLINSDQISDINLGGENE